MNNKVIGLIFRAFSQILHNQEKIMRHYGEENFFSVRRHKRTFCKIRRVGTRIF